MEHYGNDRISVTQNRLSDVQMNPIERARAEEGMKQAMLVADLTLAGVRHVLNALDSVGHATYLAFGKSRA